MTPAFIAYAGIGIAVTACLYSIASHSVVAIDSTPSDREDASYYTVYSRMVYSKENRN